MGPGPSQEDGRWREKEIIKAVPSVYVVPNSRMD